MRNISLSITIAIFAALFTGCTVQMMVPQGLHNATAMEVQGREGWLFKQKLQFGDYHTGKIRRSWASGYSIDLLVRFSGAKQKLQYSLFHEDREINVYCLNKLERADIPVAQGFFHIPLKDENIFAGAVQHEQSGNVWNFVVYQPDDAEHNIYDKGYISHGAETIQIREINRDAKGKDTWLLMGFGFYYNGKPVGAVEMLTQGRIIISRDIPVEMQETIAAVAAALLVKPQLDTQY